MHFLGIVSALFAFCSIKPGSVEDSTEKMIGLIHRDTRSLDHSSYATGAGPMEFHVSLRRAGFRAKE